MKFLEDSESLSGTRRTRDNYLIGFVRAGRTGIQYYSGAEVGSTKERVALYRPPEEVFSKDSLATLVGKPITVDHPWPAVDSSNWLQFARGQIGEGVLRDGEFIRIPISVMDEAAIKVVESGEKRELSLGYDADIDWTPGVTDSNESFDGVMRGLRYNHLSIVDVARAGSQCRIGDEVIARPVNDKNVSTLEDSRITKTKKTNTKMAESPQKIYDVNGVTIENIDQALAFAKTKDTEIATLKDTIAVRDSELAKRDSAIADLKKELEQSKLTDEQIGEQVKARASLIADAQKIITAATGKPSAAELHKLSPLAIKTAAVEAARGKSFVDGKSADYVSTAFDIVLADSANAKTQTKGADDDYSVFLDRKIEDDDDPDGQKAYEKRKEDAWKQRAA